MDLSLLEKEFAESVSHLSLEEKANLSALVFQNELMPLVQKAHKMAMPAMISIMIESLPLYADYKRMPALQEHDWMKALLVFLDTLNKFEKRARELEEQQTAPQREQGA